MKSLVAVSKTYSAPTISIRFVLSLPTTTHRSKEVEETIVWLGSPTPIPHYVSLCALPVFLFVSQTGFQRCGSVVHTSPEPGMYVARTPDVASFAV
jgi:hypothetical protein